MWSSLKIASQGVLAQQHAIDVSSSNLANADRIAYKRQRANLADVKPTDTGFGVGNQPGPLNLDERGDGGGAIMVGIMSAFEQGSAILTDHPLDFAIQGEGFLRVTTKSGEIGYTRNGSIRTDVDGQLVTSSGALVTPAIVIPKEARNVRVHTDGTIYARTGDQEEQAYGQLTLSRFRNSDGLTRAAQDLYTESAASGPAIDGRPGQEGFGALIPGTLEGSNVDPGDEIVRIMHAQRAYQVNLRSLKSADEMLQAANNLRR